jgi:hypothetical protein
MKPSRVVVALALAALLGSARGQSPVPIPMPPVEPPAPVGIRPPAPLADGPAPSLPAAPGGDEMKLQGAWTVVFSDHDAFKKCQVTFAKRTLTINDGASNISVPYDVKQGNMIGFRVLGTQWTGLFGVLGDDVVTFRFNPPPTSEPPATGRAFCVVVLERERSGPTVAPAYFTT